MGYFIVLFVDSGIKVLRKDKPGLVMYWLNMSNLYTKDKNIAFPDIDTAKRFMIQLAITRDSKKLNEFSIMSDIELEEKKAVTKSDDKTINHMELEFL